MKARMIAVGVALLLCACAVFAETAGQTRPRSLPTNLEILEELVREVVDRSLEKVPLKDSEVVLVRIAEPHEISWIVEDYLTGRLAALGTSVYLDSAASRRTGGAEASTSAGRKAGPKGRGPGGSDTTGTPSGDKPASGEDRFGSPAEADTGAAAEDPYDLDEGDEGDTAYDSRPSSETGGWTGPGGGDSLQAVSAGEEPGVGGAGPAADETAGVETAAGEAKGETPTLFAKAPTPDKVLDFRIGELDVTYTRRWRKSLFGSAMVERTARANMFFRLLDGGDGRVLWTDSGRMEKRDIVPQKMLADLEDIPGLGASKATGGGGISRVLEPVIVSGIVVGLVLLFYSSRT